MLRVKEIGESVRHYLAGDTSLETLDAWLTEHSWNMHLDSSEGAQEIIGKIELAMAEYLAGHLSKPEFRDVLLSVLNDTEIKVKGYQPKGVSSSGSTTRVTETRTKASLELVGTSQSGASWS